MRRLALLALLFVTPATATLSGCSILDPCTKKTEIVELEYGSIFYAVELDILNAYRSSGWDCRSDGAIRNVFGAEIGMRYRCTKCE